MPLNLKNTLLSTLLEHLPTCLLPKPTSSCSPRSLSVSIPFPTFLLSPNYFNSNVQIAEHLHLRLQFLLYPAVPRLNYCKTFIKVHAQTHTHTGCLRHRVARCRQGERVQSRLIIRNNFQLLNAQFNNFMCKRGNFLYPAQQIVYGSVTKLYPILYCMCLYECVRVSHTQA